MTSDQPKAAKPKQQNNTANNASGDRGKKKPKGKKGKEDENHPNLGLGIDLKNFPQTTANATKRLKLVTAAFLCSKFSYRWNISITYAYCLGFVGT